MTKRTIRFAHWDEIPAVMAFWGQHWVKDHVMSNDQELVEWQHGEEKHANFVIACNDRNEILGFLGFIPTSHFDPNLQADEVLALAGWRVRDDAPAGIGIALLGFLRREIKHRAIAILGLNDEVRQLYERLGFTTGELTHYVMVNPELKKHTIANFPNPPASINLKSSSTRLKHIRPDELTDLEKKITPPGSHLPRKSLAYIAQRYVAHPRYTYELFSVEKENDPVGVIIVRQVEASGAHALRIIDCVGPVDLLHGCGPSLMDILKTAGAEYIDLQALGLDDTTLEQEGLRRIDQIPGAVVPNLFEPFVPENRPIPYALFSHDERPLLLFKGDGDQDRPNMMNPQQTSICEATPA